MRLDLDNLLGLLFFVFFIVLPLISRANKKGQPPGKGQGRPGQPVQGGQHGAPRVPLPGQPVASSDRASPATITLEEIRRRVQEAQAREAASMGGSTPGVPAMPGAPRPMPRGLVASDPFESTLVSGAPPPSVLGREGGAEQVGTGPSALGREGSSPQPVPRPGPAPTQPTVTQPSSRTPSILGREGPAPRERGRSLQHVRPTVAPTQAAEGRARSRAEIGDHAGAAATGATNDAQRRHAASLGATLSPVAGMRFDRAGILHGLIWHEVLSEPPALKRLRRTRSRPH